MNCEIKAAMLATKKDYYKKHYKTKKIGDFTEYETTRDTFVDQLKEGDIVCIRVQGDADIKAVCRFSRIERFVANERKLILEVIDIDESGIYSAKDLFQATGNKAGAEHGWLHNCEKGEIWEDIILKYPL